LAIKSQVTLEAAGADREREREERRGEERRDDDRKQLPKEFADTSDEVVAAACK
jgi:hypothetical protein